MSTSFSKNHLVPCLYPTTHSWNFFTFWYCQILAALPRLKSFFTACLLFFLTVCTTISSKIFVVFATFFTAQLAFWMFSLPMYYVGHRIPRLQKILPHCVYTYKLSPGWNATCFTKFYLRIYLLSHCWCLNFLSPVWITAWITKSFTSVRVFSHCAHLNFLLSAAYYHILYQILFLRKVLDT